MTWFFRLRIFLDFVVLALLVGCLAYWWHGNLIHELLGTALFLLVIWHNVLNSRWLRTDKRRDPLSLFNTAIIVCLATAIMIMLLSSLLISRDLYTFAALRRPTTVRDIHMFVAYWALFFVSIHLGTRWRMVMKVGADLLGVTGRTRLRTMALRCLAAIVSVWGVKSSFEMTFGSKLMFVRTLDMWDFNEDATGFFLGYGSIVGLYVAASHYLSEILRANRKIGTPI